MGLIAVIVAACKGRKKLACLFGVWEIAAVVLLILGYSRFFLLPGAYFLIAAVCCKDKSNREIRNGAAGTGDASEILLCGNCGNPLAPGLKFCACCGVEADYAAGRPFSGKIRGSASDAEEAAPLPVPGRQNITAVKTEPADLEKAEAPTARLAVSGERMIEFRNVEKVYHSGETSIRALNGASFTVDKGQFAVILGSSGAGKTTALNILGGMDRATGGKVIVGDRDVTDFGKNELVKYRRGDIGFVFQFYNLVPNLTAKENVELAAQVCKDHLDPDVILEQVGLSERKGNFPSQLSGGEQQRVSIARALAKNPKMLLCDEPTGALDYVTGKQILQLLQDTCRKSGMTVVLITHNSALAPMADKVIRFKNGQVISETVNEHPVSISEIEW